MKDPFEAAVEEQESPPESPAQPEEDAASASPHAIAEDYDGGDGAGRPRALPPRPWSSSLAAPPAPKDVMRGKYSVKSDAFSLVSYTWSVTGRRNSSFADSEQSIDLLSSRMGALD